MREVLSTLMLNVDEAWLTHAARLRRRSTVTLADVQMEDILFRIEAALHRAERNLAPRAFTQAPTLLPPRDGRPTWGSQPH
jgi:hypothetical protein